MSRLHRFWLWGSVILMITSNVFMFILIGSDYWQYAFNFWVIAVISWVVFTINQEQS